jgi:ferredoxin-thioredoxin reductase catalytic subunit
MARLRPSSKPVQSGDDSGGDAGAAARRRCYDALVAQTHGAQEADVTLDQPTDEDRQQASQPNIDKMWKFVEKFAEKSGSYLHPQREITEFLVIGLAKHIDEVGRPLCPCNFYEDKAEEAKSSTWICACDEMQKYKYCH